VMQKPLSLPLVMPLPPNCFAQPLKYFHIELSSNTLSKRYELMVQQTVDVKNITGTFWLLSLA
jgi:hypothetical protein